MRILVNSIPLTELMTGIQRYVRCLYTCLEMFPDVAVSYFGRFGSGSRMPPQAKAGRWAKRIGLINRFPDPIIVGGRILDRLGFEWRLRKSEPNGKYDIYHETAFFPPVLENVPVVYTVYDLSLIKHADKHPRERVWFSDLYFRRRLPRAAHVITISDFTRNELIQETGIPPQKVTAVHLAHGASFCRRSRSEISQMLDCRGWPKEYILFVGTLEPRKNLQLLIRALSMLNSEIPLLVTGWSGWGDKRWWDEIYRMGLRKRVILTGYLDENSLSCLYGGASAFVYPSLYEGFGLPVLEAMASGCPVLCSNRASLPEVAGDAAMLIDPHDAEGLAFSLEKVLFDSSLRSSLIAAGLQRAASFSWEKTARATLNVFQRVAAGKAF